MGYNSDSRVKFVVACILGILVLLGLAVTINFAVGLRNTWEDQSIRVTKTAHERKCTENKSTDGDWTTSCTDDYYIFTATEIYLVGGALFGNYRPIDVWGRFREDTTYCVRIHGIGMQGVRYPYISKIVTTGKCEHPQKSNEGVN